MLMLTGDNLPLPQREKDTHKGDYGHVLLIGGGPGMLGAIGLAALACFRAGAGMVSIATRPEHAAHGTLLSLVPEAMVFGIHKPEELSPLLARATVCVIGPGLGDSDWARCLFDTAMHAEHPLVVDASALRLLAQFPQKKDNWVLTPHPGEAAELLACSKATLQADRVVSAKNIQLQYGGVIVLKGKNTVVKTTQSKTFICPRGNPGMATAGMGDVLTGVIAGLIAQGLSLSEAAKTGVWVHATAGDHVAKMQGERGILASDLPPIFPLILNGLI